MRNDRDVGGYRKWRIFEGFSRLSFLQTDPAILWSAPDRDRCEHVISTRAMPDRVSGQPLRSVTERGDPELPGALHRHRRLSGYSGSATPSIRGGQAGSCEGIAGGQAHGPIDGERGDPECQVAEQLAVAANADLTTAEIVFEAVVEHSTVVGSRWCCRSGMVCRRDLGPSCPGPDSPRGRHRGTG